MNIKDLDEKTIDFVYERIEKALIDLQLSTPLDKQEAIFRCNLAINKEIKKIKTEYTDNRHQRWLNTINLLHGDDDYGSDPRS